MSKKPKKSQLDKLVMNNRLARDYAKSFDEDRIRLDELDREAFRNMVRGEEPPKAIFKVLANAAQDLNHALEGLEGAEPVEIIRGPAAGLCGAIQRVAQTLGNILPNAGPTG
jgi:hypothetical protein